MLRKYLTCDICGDKWDITSLPYANNINPGESYAIDCVINGKRNFNIQKLAGKSDDGINLNIMDICDKCYHKLDKFIYDLTYGGADGKKTM